MNESGIVGSLNWLVCATCKHYRPIEGGCKPLDRLNDLKLRVNVEDNTVECLEFEKRESK